MSFDNLLADLIDISQLGLCRRRNDLSGRDFESHHNDSASLARRVENTMGHGRREVHEIVFTHWNHLITVKQRSLSFQHNVDLFFTRRAYGRAFSSRINGDFTEPGHPPHNAGVRVSLSEDGFVMAGPGRDVHLFFLNVRNEAMQKGWINGMILGPKAN
jgi:hypothetical protein